jgi:hypothetical protein
MLPRGLPGRENVGRRAAEAGAEGLTAAGFGSPHPRRGAAAGPGWNALQ